MLTGVGRSELVQTNSCDNGEYFNGDVAGDVGVRGREGGRALWRQEQLVFGARSPGGAVEAWALSEQSS